MCPCPCIEATGRSTAAGTRCPFETECTAVISLPAGRSPSSSSILTPGTVYMTTASVNVCVDDNCVVQIDRKPQCKHKSGIYCARRAIHGSVDSLEHSIAFSLVAIYFLQQ